MGKIICISSQKGGVGKTTTAVNLSAALALAEKKLLLLDLDFQGHATNMLGRPDDDQNKSSIYDALTGKAPIEKLIRDTDLDFLKFIPADVRLINTDLDLRQSALKELILKEQLESIKEDFDLIILDSPPSFNIFGINGINAADILIIPLQCEYYALKSLGQFFKIFHGLKSKYKSSAEIGGILLNMYDPYETVSRQIAHDVKKSFNGMVYKTIIPRFHSTRKTATCGKPIILTDIESEGARSYLSLASEIIGKTHSF